MRFAIPLMFGIVVLLGASAPSFSGAEEKAAACKTDVEKRAFCPIPSDATPPQSVPEGCSAAAFSSGWKDSVGGLKSLRRHLEVDGLGFMKRSDESWACSAFRSGEGLAPDLSCCEQGYRAGLKALAETIRKAGEQLSSQRSAEMNHCLWDASHGESDAEGACTYVESKKNAAAGKGVCPPKQEPYFSHYLGCYFLGLARGMATNAKCIGCRDAGELSAILRLHTGNTFDGTTLKKLWGGPAIGDPDGPRGSNSARDGKK